MFILLKEDINSSYGSIEGVLGTLAFKNGEEYTAARTEWNQTLAKQSEALRQEYRDTRKKGAPKELGWEKLKEKLKQLHLSEDDFLNKYSFMPVDFDISY
jgi:hypothetical protein